MHDPSPSVVEHVKLGEAAVAAAVNALNSSTLPVLSVLSSVDARMWLRVPNLWNSMALNWIRMMAKKKNTRTIPMGSK